MFRTTNRLCTLCRSPTSFNLSTKTAYATLNKNGTSSTSRKPLTPSRDRVERDEAFKNYIQTAKNLSGLKDFKQYIFKEFAKSTLNEQSFDSTFMRACVATRNYPLAKAYLEHLQKVDNKLVNTATLARFLQLCYFCHKEVEDIVEVEQLCSSLQSRSEFLDIHSKEYLIMALSTTSRWREGLEMIEKDVYQSSSVAMNAIIDRLLAEGEIEQGFTLMERALQTGKIISDSVYEHWIHNCTMDESVWQIFAEYLARNEVFLNEMLTERLTKMLVDQKGYTANRTTVDAQSGRCRCCNQMLQELSISADDFETLRSVMMEKVLIGSDVFLSSTPQEVERFKQFILKIRPYDIVIDGLNVAYSSSSSPKSRMQTLHVVVDHFHRQNKKVLVLGRDHMLRWDWRLWSKVKEKAYIFTTTNLTRDDPFLLYACLQDPGTCVVSDDIFRDHVFKLGDNRLRAIFRTWQRAAQLQVLRIGLSSEVRMQYPPKHRTVVQSSSNGSWHVPYDDGTPRYSYQLPTSWVCFQPKQKYC